MSLQGPDLHALLDEFEAIRAAVQANQKPQAAALLAALEKTVRRSARLDLWVDFAQTVQLYRSADTLDPAGRDAAVQGLIERAADLGENELANRLTRLLSEGGVPDTAP